MRQCASDASVRQDVRQDATGTQNRSPLSPRLPRIQPIADRIAAMRFWSALAILGVSMNRPFLATSLIVMRGLPTTNSVTVSSHGSPSSVPPAGA